MDDLAAVLEELKCTECKESSETAPFVEQEEEDITHEATCQHRNSMVCPLLGSARCDWLGTRTEILQHCQTEHLDEVVDNPATLVHDISKDSTSSHLLQAFEVLFVLYTEVCLVSEKIFHSIQCLDTLEDAENFVFTLEIKRSNEELSKDGLVMLLEPTTLGVDISSFLDGATVTVTVKQRKPVEKCTKCTTEVTVFRYCVADGWLCEDCGSTKRPCQNHLQGCTHTDTHNKCNKHEDHFCEHHTHCTFCYARVSPGSLFTHYDSVHKDMTHEAGSTWRMTRSRGERCLVSSVAGTAVCWYSFMYSQFVFKVIIPVSSERLSEFRCEVKVTDPATGYTSTFTPPTEYDDWYDWHIKVEKEDFPSWNIEMDVCVDIRKAD